MKKIALFLFYVALFFGALLFFTPKVNLYFFLEEQIKPFEVVIASEEAVDRGFSLELNHAQLYVKKIKSADIATVELTLLGFYNALTADKIVLDSAVEQFFPPVINRIEIGQTIFSPFQLSGRAVGDFGEAVATVDLLERNASILLTPSKLMSSRYKKTLRELKRTKEGAYRYDYQF